MVASRPVVFVGFMFVVLFSAALQARIMEAPRMVEAMEFVDQDTLLVFDLDNTVMMPAQTLGGEEWFDYLVKKYAAERTANGETAEVAKSNAIAKALAQWNEVQLVTEMVPVEQETPNLIKNAQGLGAEVMSLTARPVELSDRTRVQLAAIGIDFSKSRYGSAKFAKAGKARAEFIKGIMFAGPNNNKGEILVQFLKENRWEPKRIVFVDNKLHHVENVEKALTGFKVEYFGCRHGAADKKIAAFDSAIADLQHKLFGRILSDKDAAALLQSQSR